MQIMLALVFSFVFGLGIIVSGMGNPAKVLAFFDVAGTWDPSLAFVMAGALAVTAIGYRIAFARGAPLLATEFNLPTATRVDAQLIAGSAVFGIGWGLTGFCPGAALPMLAIGRLEPLIFTADLVAGLIAARTFRAAAARHTQAEVSARGGA